MCAILHCNQQRNSYIDLEITWLLGTAHVSGFFISLNFSKAQESRVKAPRFAPLAQGSIIITDVSEKLKGRFEKLTGSRKEYLLAQFSV